MNTTNKTIKQTVREKLLGHWSEHIVYALILIALESIFASVAGSIRQANLTGVIFSLIVSIILQLLLGLFYAGASYHFLKCLRGEVSAVTDLIAPFKMQPDRFLIVGLIRLFAGFLVFSPIFLADAYAGAGGPPDALFLFACVWFVIGGILFLFVKAALAMTTFLLLEHPDMGALASVRTSVRMMKGQKVRFVLLLLSFAGYLILCVFTFGIGLLWVLPYLFASETQFYLEQPGLQTGVPFQ